MSNLLPSFIKGADLVLRIGDIEIANCVGLSFRDAMNNALVYGMGSYSPRALEPLSYAASGSLTITRYSDAVIQNARVAARPTAPGPAGTLQTAAGQLPDGVRGTSGSTRDGNSLAELQYFSPAQLLLSSTFDIDVYVRANVGDTYQSAEAGLRKLWTLKDCRFNNLSWSFAPGQLLNESYSFVITSVEAAEYDLNKTGGGRV